MAKLDKQGLNTFIRELDKHINTKINRLDISPTADKVMMQDGTSVEETVNANKTSILRHDELINQAIEKSEQAFQRGNNVKNALVDTLIAKGFNVSTNDSFEDINITINKTNLFTTSDEITDFSVLYFSKKTQENTLVTSYKTYASINGAGLPASKVYAIIKISGYTPATPYPVMIRVVKNSSTIQNFTISTTNESEVICLVEFNKSDLLKIDFASHTHNGFTYITGVEVFYYLKLC